MKGPRDPGLLATSYHNQLFCLIFLSFFAKLSIFMDGKRKTWYSESVMNLVSCKDFYGTRIDFCCYWFKTTTKNLTSRLSDAIASWKAAAIRISSVWVNSLTSPRSRRKRSGLGVTDNFRPSACRHAHPFISSTRTVSLFSVLKDWGGWLEFIFKGCLWMIATTIRGLCRA